MIVSIDWLYEQGCCESSIRKFAHIFGTDEVELTQEVVKKSIEAINDARWLFYAMATKQDPEKGYIKGERVRSEFRELEEKLERQRMESYGYAAYYYRDRISNGDYSLESATDILKNQMSMADDQYNQSRLVEFLRVLREEFSITV